MERNEVYICSVSEDNALRDELKTMLEPLAKFKQFSVWDYTNIPFGFIREHEIKKAMERAKTVVLLVSPDFLASDAFQRDEFPELRQAAERGELSLVLVLARPCLHESTDLKGREFAHNPKQAFSSLSRNDRQQALTEICEKIDEAMQRPVSNESRPGSTPTMDNCEILLFAANPLDKDPLALDQEVREIEHKIRASKHRNNLRLVSKWAATTDDWLQAFNEYAPTIVHFSGHGSATTGIHLMRDHLMDEEEQSHVVSGEILAMLFQSAGKSVRLVLLNACYSQDQAEAIVEQVDCVVGMGRKISDLAATLFAASFYRALGFGKSVQEAYDQGKTAILLKEGFLHKESEGGTPELLCKSGVDAKQVYLLEGS